MIVNFYNKIKKEIKLDFKEDLDSIYFNILHSLGLADYFITTEKRYKRINQKETTKYIVEEATEKVYHCPNFLNRFLYLEYNNEKIHYGYKDKTGENKGFVDGGEIFLKLDEDYIEQCSLEENINLYFKSKDNDNNEVVTMVSSKRNELFSEVLKLFFLKSGYSNEKKFDYIFNSKSLKFNLINSLEEIGLLNGSIILVFSHKNIKGAGGLGYIDFVDVKSGKIKKLKFDPKAPNWRRVTIGLNIFGFCKNSECKPFEKEVIYPVGVCDEFHDKFDLKKEVRNIICPKCNGVFKAETCGFYKCEYQFYGQLIEEGKIKDYTSDPKETKNNEFEYFNPYENGKKEWLELIIYTLPKQEIKYKNN